jgi:hypothetical protein
VKTFFWQKKKLCDKNFSRQRYILQQHASVDGSRYGPCNNPNMAPPGSGVTTLTPGELPFVSAVFQMALIGLFCFVLATVAEHFFCPALANVAAALQLPEVGGLPPLPGVYGLGFRVY